MGTLHRLHRSHTEQKDVLTVDAEAVKGAVRTVTLWLDVGGGAGPLPSAVCIRNIVLLDAPSSQPDPHPNYQSGCRQWRWLDRHHHLRCAALQLHRDRPSSVSTVQWRQHVLCSNHDCLNERDIFWFTDGVRRCFACTLQYREHGTERTAELVEEARRRERVHAENLAQAGCRNPNCLVELDGILDFVGEGEDRRCNWCHRYRKTYKTDRPLHVVERSRQKALARRDNLARIGCLNPNCMKPYNDHNRFVGGGEGRRCEPCADYRKKNPESDRPLEWVNEARRSSSRQRIWRR